MTASSVERITTLEALHELAPEWDALAAARVPWTPFATPAWNLAYWRHFRRNNLLVRDELHAFSVRCAAGQLLAVAPMQLTSRPGYGPAQLRQLHYFGADPNMTEIRGLVCRPEDEHAAATALAAHLRKHRSWDLLHWAGLARHAAAHRDVAAAAQIAQERPVVDFYLDLPDSFEAFRSSLPRNTKEALRKCYNSLDRDGHAFSFDVVSDADTLDGALGTFFSLHAARAEAEGEVAHPNVFATPAARGFLSDYARGAAQRGELRIFRLSIADQVVAMRIGFCVGDDLYLYYSGYCPDWGRYSVMTTVVTEALRWAVAHGLKRVNLSIGRDRSKLRWRPVELEMWEGMQVNTGLRGRLIGELFRRRRNVRMHWTT